MARVYSRAMLDLAEAQDEAEGLLAELAELAAYLDRSPEFAAFMASPLVDADERAASIKKLFRDHASHLLVDSLQVLNRKGRLALVGAVAETYREQYQRRRGKIDVQVRTAVPLTTNLREKLRAAAAGFTGKDPELIEEVDESMIGGMVLRIGDQKLDGSVAYEIRKLRATFHERAVHEIHNVRGVTDAAD
ncbi:MAG: ATP synthase F1 subunit delta [bacterium]|nr:ATP synthase F1 subunit delta [bacterium]